MHRPFLAAFVRTREDDFQPATRGPEALVKHVSVNRVPIGKIVSSRWGYWHAETLDGRVIHGDFGYQGWRRAMWALIRDVEARGELPSTPEKPRTRAEWLRYLASYEQHGQPTTAAGVYLSSWCGADAYRKVSDTLHPWPSPGEPPKTDAQRKADSAATAAKIDELVAFQSRYKRFLHQVREVSPGWKLVETIGYADNSTEVREVATDGRVRQRMTVGPGGDACF